MKILKFNLFISFVFVLLFTHTESFGSCKGGFLGKIFGGTKEKVEDITERDITETDITETDITEREEPDRTQLVPNNQKVQQDIQEGLRELQRRKKKKEKK